LGYKVIRFWNHEILTEPEAVLEKILAELQASPHPNPLPVYRPETRVTSVRGHG
jgi:hypothetical protein